MIRGPGQIAAAGSLQAPAVTAAAAPDIRTAPRGAAHPNDTEGGQGGP